MTPGEAQRAHRELEAAEGALREAALLLDAGALQGAASRLYYAVFHAARAALTVRGLYAKTHSGQITLFERTFGAAPILEQLFTLRGRADYALERFEASADDLRARSDEASAFLDRCRAVVEEALARGPDEPDPPPDL